MALLIDARNKKVTLVACVFKGSMMSPYIEETQKPISKDSITMALYAVNRNIWSVAKPTNFVGSAFTCAPPIQPTRTSGPRFEETSTGRYTLYRRARPLATLTFSL